MIIEVKTEKEKIDSYEICDAPAKMNGLTEIHPNRWKCSFGNWYILTKMGFKRLKGYE